MTESPKTQKPATHAHPPEGTVAWYFAEFWVVMIFGLCFILMCSTPIMLSFTWFPKYLYMGPSGVVDFRFGLGLLISFLFSFVVLFTVPRLIGWYVFLLGVFALIFMNGFHQYMAIHWGPWTAIWYLGNLFLANFYLPQKNKD